jgi:rhamnulokinase
MGRYIAVDLGATSGRVALVDTTQGNFDITMVHRFHHETIESPGGDLYWNWDHIIEQSIIGIRAAAALGPVTSLAIDSWGVDYGFLNSRNELLPPIFSYRDLRNKKSFTQIIETLGKERIFQSTGIQFIPLNTINQLFASKKDSNYLAAEKFLLLPDLLNNLLTGSETTEITNASTTQLLNGRTRSWDYELISQLNLRREIFPGLHEPGTTLGTIKGFGNLDGIVVVAVGSHDTASAVAGIPFTDIASEAYLSSGTWSLLGIESETPITTPEALAANITNELGVEGTVRILKNITGLWILEECRRSWSSEGLNLEMPEIISLAQSSNQCTSVIDPNDPIFADPGDMPDRVKAYVKQSGQQVPQTYGEIARTIFLSLAIAYKRTLDELENVTGRKIKTLYIVGGGSQIEILDQFAADASLRTVIAGPTEVTIYGNAMVQTITAGEFSDLKAARAAMLKGLLRKKYLPKKELDWVELEARIHG